MSPETFYKMMLDKAKKEGKNYGIFSPPTEAHDGLSILIDHFLGSDWYSMNPIHREQINTEAINEILEKYPGKIERKKMKNNMLIDIGLTMLIVIILLYFIIRFIES